MTVEVAKDYQKDYLDYLKNIRKGNKNAKPREILANLNMLYNAREKAIKFIEDYGSMILEAKRLAREQALAQVKAGNNSESLLNEIRQIVYSLYRSKEITKKVYNNIINSVKV